MAEKLQSARQRRTRFIKEYLLEHNATKAAIAAGYSEKTAKQQGSRLLTNADVQDEIAARSRKLTAKLDISVERVAQEFARIAFNDPRKLFKDDGSLKPVSEWDDDSAAAIGGMDVSELFDGAGDERAQVGYLKKVKMTDKVRALEGLGRYLAMFVDRKEITHKHEDVSDADLNKRIAELERELGLAAQIDEAGRVGIAQAGESETHVGAKDTDVLS